MSELAFLVGLVVVIALVFDFTNGFHDAANAIATSVATRALTPAVALGMAAVMNFIGALLGTAVAETIGSGIVHIGDLPPLKGLNLVLGALMGAIVWNLITWWKGLPSSSSHALIGALAGAGLASSTQVHWGVILDKVVIPMVLSPAVGFFLAYILMKIVLMLLRNATYRSTMHRFRYAQTVSAAAMALGHGLQDAQKTMGVMVLAMAAGGYHDLGSGIPLWVKLSAAGAISAGTAMGGFKIMKTLGSGIIDLDPARGFVAESIAASVLYTTAFVWAAPISTTHTVTCAIMGVGATKRKSAVRWGIAGNIVTAWVLTLPAAAAVAGVTTWLLHLVI
ncbi:inorganic phosphate transporter [Actinotignum urinale]|uniref:Inorganic phosphate transporter n=1 Tax=Actinotignum urinale TaxID=190146 RepID=A0AAW9HRT5_9ACTO|nr:inorganic phosphate transporter [Actinotignum urinale]MDY5129336.1 inorganic phosphate transporter [Actinotignum urinale]MDY5151733.1 inorganic phosphate transporter [Actinotignum urinale]MDY5154378.1 inorganic phosphate transporter [Actinotignum urinale]